MIFLCIFITVQSVDLEKTQESEQVIELPYTMTECCTEESLVSKELGQTKESNYPCVVTTVEFGGVTFNFDISCIMIFLLLLSEYKIFTVKITML